MLARRAFLARSAGITVAFSLPLPAFAQTAPAAAGPPTGVDAWLGIDAAGAVSVRFGKVELGTGIATAIRQIVADELDVAFAAVSVPEADTATTPDQGYTAGSASLSAGAVPVRKAAAEARLALLDLAAARFGVPANRLETRDGAVLVAGGAQRASYAELIGGRAFNRTIAATTVPKNPDGYRVVGRSFARVDLPAKVFGSFAYMQNLRVPGMLHGRVIRPPAIGATLTAVDESSVAGLPGVRVVRLGSGFLGVVAPEEWTAIAAMRRLKTTWSGGGLAPVTDLAAAVRAVPEVSRKAIVDTGDLGALAGGAIDATYVWPHQSHGSIGPSCAVADVRDGRATIWSGTQGIFFLRGALAQLLNLPAPAVRVRYVEAAGCYGHNGADDAAADAALLSQAAGAPVRVQWMRDQEHGWDPKGPAMVVSLSGALGTDGRIAAWRSDVWTPTHSTRPQNEAGNLLAGRLTGSPAAQLNFGGGDRDAKVNYVIPNYRVTMHNLLAGLLHSSALRGLGGVQNTFANESFMDELAAAAGADPIAFRRAHLANDARALALLDALTELGAWQPHAPGSRIDPVAPLARGRGVSFVRYENTEAYVAAIADVAVERATGAVRVERLAIAHDCGLVINPDGLRNQIEGNAIQALSRTLKEAVTFDTRGVTSIDWRTYPIVRFSDVPAIAIALVDRPHEPVLGAGEATSTVIAPAIGNAIYDAVGVRLRTVPFTPARVAAALQTG
jgi:CO/xanthine dehydrogenase Mo-binding subunit